MTSAKIFAGILSFFLSFVALADGGGAVISGGGHGIEEAGRIYLLDFYERGIHQKNFDWVAPVLGCEDTNRWITKTSSSFGFCGDLIQETFPDKQFAHRLSGFIDLFQRNEPVLGMAVLKAVRFLNWIYTDQPLKPIEAGTILAKPIVQVAARVGNQVYIHRPSWEKMDEVNRIGLVVHEAMAALVDPQVKSPMTVRTAVGYLFELDVHVERADRNMHWSFFPTIQNLLQSPMAPYFQLQENSDFLTSANEFGDLQWPDESLVNPMLRGSISINPVTGEALKSLGPVREIRFMPQLQYSWKEKNAKGQWVSKFVNRAFKTNQDTRLLFCSKTPTFESGSLILGYLTLEVRPRDQLQNGYETPLLEWIVKYNIRSMISCADPEAPAQLKAAKVWLSLFRSNEF